MRKIKLLIDNKPFIEKPKGIEVPQIKNRFNNPNSIKEVTIEELFKCIENGLSYIPGVLEGGTKNENWVQQELVAIDIDNEKEERIVTPTEIISMLEDKNINPIGYYHTFSSSESKPKFRILFLLENPITEAKKMDFIIRSLIEYIPQSDKACKDLSRLFYGTYNKEIKILNKEARISLEDIIKLNSPSSKAKRGSFSKNTKLEQLIDNYDLLEYMKKENEVNRTTGNCTYFKNCSICGHSDCLRYYKDTNTFYCFGSNGEVGGNIIDYLIATKDITRIEAIDYFKYDLMKLERTPFENNLLKLKEEHLQIVRKQLKEIKLNNPTIDDCKWIEYEKSKKGVTSKISCPLLAQFIRENINYIFVRSHAKSGILRYFYLNGYYKQLSDEEIKGIIKSFIPLELQKTRDINEVFGLLYTDQKFIAIEKLNTNENIINFENGILDLKTGEMLPHDPSYLSTIKIPCNYVDNAPIPQNRYFDRFIDKFTNESEEIKSLILQFIGVTISNIKGYRMKQALFMVGDGNTGKSVCKNFVTNLIGSENCSSADLKSLQKQFGKIALLNKRMVGSNDMSFMTISELETFKMATGGDPINAEFKGENAIDFVFNGILWFCGNELPKFGGDRGDWVYDRIVIIESKNVITEEDQDKQLDKHLLEEKEYIVSLAINELKKVIQNGYKYNIPNECEILKENYKDINDSFRLFMKECVIDRPVNNFKDNVTTGKFYELYKAWCNDNNNGYAEPKIKVKKILENFGKSEIKKTNGGNTFYTKITVKQEVIEDYKNIVHIYYTYENEDIDKILETDNTDLDLSKTDENNLTKI